VKKSFSHSDLCDPQSRQTLIRMEITMNKVTRSNKNIFVGISNLWKNFKEKHPNSAQFIVFFALSNGVTLLQLILMPALKGAFLNTSLVDMNFQILQIGRNFDGSDYYVFNYAAGSLSSGGGGGLAYFLAVQITLAIAQIINFFAQRSITFKSNSNVWRAAFWYVLAYIIISIGAAAAQGLYKAPIYNLFMNVWNMNSLGETIADFITMIINSSISFWVFFPIFKVIFKNKPETVNK
jgi:putative flippase GtrA